MIECSDNYSDTSGSLWHFKRDEPSADNAYLTATNYKSFEYKAALIEKTKKYADGSGFAKNTKMVVRLKYLSNFWRSLEMPLIS